MTESAPVLATKVEGILSLTLNRPERLNAVTDAMGAALVSQLRAAQDDKSVRCVVLRGAGKGFCTGQDLKALDLAQHPDLGAIVQRCYNPCITHMTSLDKPIIAAVHGTAAGAGANLAFAADFIIASADAVFIQSFVHVGLIPDSGGTFILPRVLGLARANAFTMLGEKMTAPEAERLGLIYRSVAPEEFDASVNGLAARLAKMPTKALGLTKRLLRDGMNGSLQQQLSAEAAAQRTAGTTEDFAEGARAFLEKRAAHFKGS